jgi:hypothetical protein
VQPTLDKVKKTPIQKQDKSSGGSSSKTLSNTPVMQQKSSAHSEMFNATPIQKKADKTGLPADLKGGMESLSGMSLDHVKVHYNSSKPAAVQAHAYAQGSEIHVANGQEQHLPHELGHVVQQAQGRIQPTTAVDGQPVNDAPSLEAEADQLGAQAMQKKAISSSTLKTSSSIKGAKQLTRKRSGAISLGSHRAPDPKLLGLGQGTDGDASLKEEDSDTLGTVTGGIETALSPMGDLVSEGFTGTIDSTGPVKTNVTGVDGQLNQSVKIAGGVLGMVNGFASMANADDGIELMEGYFKTVAGGLDAANGIASLIGNTKGDQAGAIFGMFASGCTLVAQGFAIVHKIVKEDNVSKGEMAQIGVDSLSAIQSVVGGISDIFEKFSTASPALLAANPALQIAISAIKAIMNAYYLYISFQQKDIMNARQKKIVADAGGNEQSYLDATEFYRAQDAIVANKEDVVRSDTKRLAKLDASSEEGQFLQARITTLESECVREKGRRASLSRDTVEEFAVARELAYINKKRVVRQSVHIVTNMAKVAGSIAILTGGGALVGVGINTASSGVEAGMVGVRGAKQKARDVKARKEAKGKTLAKLDPRRMADASKSSAAKQSDRLEKVRFIIKQVVKEAKKPAILREEGNLSNVKNYIKATGVNTGKLYAANGQPSEQITLLFKAMSQRELTE